MPNAKNTTARSTKTVARKAVPAKKAATKRAPAKKAAPVRAVKTAAEIRKATKLKNARIQAEQGKHKPNKSVFTKGTFCERIAADSGLDKRSVLKMWAAVEALAQSSLMPRAIGELTLPGVVKLLAKKIPAKKGGQKVMSFGVERISKPKAATVRVKARPLGKLKLVAIPVH